MLKSFMEFLVTGAVVIVGYFVYFVTAFIITIIIGLPIAFGIKTLIDIVNLLFAGVNNANI
jgi:hypothetical protein